MDRRQLLISSILAASAQRCASPRTQSGRPRSLRLLVLGGTNYVGPAIVSRARAAGHSVTLFNRGITRPYLFTEIERLRGDRRQGIDGLATLVDRRTWDAVIDVWPADEALVRDTARLLADRVGYYFYISSIAVYRSFLEPGVPEDAPMRREENGYGGAKARCEDVVAKTFPGRFGIARCPPVFGPMDPGSSLHYWLRSFSRRPRVLAPSAGQSAMQLIDVGDVAQWTINAIETKQVGVYNVMTDPMPYRDFLTAAHRAVDSKAKTVWVDETLLRSEGVQAFTDLPLWIPAGEDPGFFRISNAKAKGAGLRCQPLETTLAAAWRWYRSAFFDDTTFPANGMGISEQRHDALLQAWASRPK